MIVLKHPTGVIKECVTGYSWTTFFFGCFVPLFRGDLKWAGILFLINVLAGFVTAGIGSFIPNIVFAYFYNKLYIKDLIEKGYKPCDETARQWLVQNGVIVSDVPLIEENDN